MFEDLNLFLKWILIFFMSLNFENIINKLFIHSHDYMYIYLFSDMSQFLPRSSRNNRYIRHHLVVAEI